MSSSLGKVLREEICYTNWAVIVAEATRSAKICRLVEVYDEAERAKERAVGRWLRLVRALGEQDLQFIQISAAQYLAVKYEPRIAG